MDNSQAAVQNGVHASEQAFYPDQNGDKDNSNTSMSDADDLGDLPPVKQQIRAVDLDDIIERLIHYDEHHGKDRSLEE